MTHLKTDYLVVGSGAMGMAFVDTLLSDSDADIILIDRFAKPGGHWNNAYPFVTLHQPSQFYGVPSKELSQGRIDTLGLNKGLGDLATGAEILAYFEDVMRNRFLTSGRVRYFPLCDYQGDGKFVNTLSGEEFEVEHDKLVDATFLKTSVPSTHTPNFTIAPEARFMPLNDLPKLAEPAAGYVIIGGGKTGIDAALWLLEMGVPADDITWIMSRDAWLLNRENTQPTMEFFEQAMGAQAGQFESIASAETPEDMFLKLEACGYFLRLDPNVLPEMFHGATISPMEVEELRKIKNIIRLGRVVHLGENEITLVQGTIPTSPNHIHVDCSASAINHKDIKPVFQGKLITPQTVRAYQPVFSGSMIAHIEASDRTEAEKNALCGVVPIPDTLHDYMRMTAANMMNQVLWGQDKEIRKWMVGNRLDGFSKMVSEVDPDDSAKVDVLKRMRAAGMPAMMKLQQFLAAN
ncbi:NAD(P)/FAD-dependent oxidoreductase [Litorimonas sp. RW-G-Af-16]|uniref:NAD(P)/FAD-dependent oxidoreductase n=1 Tax=Litorimonas sp. RW-G-Af-16 TaxID=3241168 RepID=UPI00390C4717